MFEKLEGVERGNNELLDAEESIKFWNETWSKRVDRNRSARWIHDIDKQTTGVEKQKKVKITAELIAKQVRKLSNWKSLGPGGVHGFWMKKIPGIRS